MQVDIQKLGADAARQGLTLLDCPYLRTAAMPAQTGESVNEWRSRVEMWKAGWKDGVKSRAVSRTPSSPFMSIRR
ncbi:CrpP-related protein [Achromobacter mucicolens]|uniref:Uncharacterized protein n=1 Tax=Achromobacter mucicolens TaxID=1389922 RepID=A0ABM8LLB0_9BURK|nr:CrpP-related protein [Achromobacter mucicolens]OXC90410.1 hypothetical protein BMR85_015295 [Achromobacter sp. KAs 3-5]MCP2517150.1 hypothetical protein [Achromobacter mucicolens]MDG9972065.1 hypothetical protein [Achromobacter mucicolens]WBX86816.1 hypothetical protein PE062_15225 [Achromobacter mucicolens]WGJ89156.1 hypothetical protein QEP15_17585 [Achromobacter mucicolens]